MDHALSYEKAGTVSLVPIPSPSITETCQVIVRALWSGISRGTERLVFSGKVPESEYDRMRAPHQRGDFPFPVIYGYSMVGQVIDGPQHLAGKAVFALYPHQSRFALPADSLTVLPDDLPPRRAILAANMETALNAVWDSGAGPGDRIAIVGGGILGALIAGICGAIPGSEVTLIDIDRNRRSLADDMNVKFASPDSTPKGCDIVFHTSSNASGLDTAIHCAGFEGIIVELSWYGNDRPQVSLGGAFHSQRLRLVSSQVGHVSPGRRPRWSHARRMNTALTLLLDDRFDSVITQEVDFSDLPTALPALLANGAPGLATAIRYESE